MFDRAEVFPKLRSCLPAPRLRRPVQVFDRVEVQPRDAREASDVFYKQGKGDALLTYENEAVFTNLVVSPNEKLPCIVPNNNVRVRWLAVRPGRAPGLACGGQPGRHGPLCCGLQQPLAGGVAAGGWPAKLWGLLWLRLLLWWQHPLLKGRL